MLQRRGLAVSSLLLATVRSAVIVQTSGMSTGAASMRAVVAHDGAVVIAPRPLPLPKAGEVIVKVHYSAINRADTLQRKGLYPPPAGESDVLGLEVCGVVTGQLPAAFALAPLPNSADPALPLPCSSPERS